MRTKWFFKIRNVQFSYVKIAGDLELIGGLNVTELTADSFDGRSFTDFVADIIPKTSDSPISVTGKLFFFLYWLGHCALFTNFKFLQVKNSFETVVNGLFDIVQLSNGDYSAYKVYEPRIQHL